MFASVPNFTEFYSEDVNKGMECIRLLNEIIGTAIIVKLAVYDINNKINVHGIDKII